MGFLGTALVGTEEYSSTLKHKGAPEQHTPIVVAEDLVPDRGPCPGFIQNLTGFLQKPTLPPLPFIFFLKRGEKPVCMWLPFKSENEAGRSK